MSDKIQITEEQANEMIHSCLAVGADKYIEVGTKTIENMKKNGYIKQSDLEIAKGEFYKHSFIAYDKKEWTIICIYIAELEKELKNENRD